MHICYIDESGTADVPGNTSHYVLAGLSIPDNYWNSHNEQMEDIKRRYRLSQAEIHVAWMLRPYVEQEKVPNFGSMTHEDRRLHVLSERRAEIFRLEQANKKYQRSQTRTNYDKTDSYIHLTLAERRQAVRDLAELVGSWGVARLFADCIDKEHFDPIWAGKGVDEEAFKQIVSSKRRKAAIRAAVTGEAFKQVVSRFERYLKNINTGHGLLVHDNNKDVARRHTEIMKRFLQSGTPWTDVNHIIETPFFVDSELTSMVQLADLCAYAIRRYVENGEEELFDLVFQRADKVGTTAVGVRHFTQPGCPCKICVAHNPV